MSTAPTSETIKTHAAFIWSVADLLRSDYKQSECGKVILPLTVLRRLDCVLEPTKTKVLERHAQMEGKIDNLGPILEKAAGQHFYNTSKLDLPRLLDRLGRAAAHRRAATRDLRLDTPLRLSAASVLAD